MSIYEVVDGKVVGFGFKVRRRCSPELEGYILGLRELREEEKKVAEAKEAEEQK